MKALLSQRVHSAPLNCPWFNITTTALRAYWNIDVRNHYHFIYSRIKYRFPSSFIQNFYEYYTKLPFLQIYLSRTFKFCSPHLICIVCSSFRKYINLHNYTLHDQIISLLFESIHWYWLTKGVFIVNYISNTDKCSQSLILKVQSAKITP